MALTPNLTEEILSSFLACRYKAHLKLRCAVCEESDYIRFQARTATEYRNAARKVMLEIRPDAVAARDPPSLTDAIRGGADLIFDATISDGDESCRLDAVVRIAEGNDHTGGAYFPVLFTQHERVMPGRINGWQDTSRAAEHGHRQNQKKMTSRSATAGRPGASRFVHQRARPLASV
jgi:hypothetical protein